MELSKKFRGENDLEMTIDKLQKKSKPVDQNCDHKNLIQSYKNIIDQKELVIEELKKANDQLKKELEEEKNHAQLLYESP
jgi:predicted RNase H-like nuclease (RuvC/YqgF family)